MEWVVALLVVGALLLLAETVLPGMVAGIIGALCLAGGIIEAYVEFGATTGNRVVLVTLTVLLVGGALWLRWLPRSRAARWFRSDSVTGDNGVTHQELLDQTGTTVSTLRPCGMALINGRRVDVVTEGLHLESGRPVRVVSVEGLRVVVRPV